MQDNQAPGDKLEATAEEGSAEGRGQVESLRSCIGNTWKHSSQLQQLS